MTTKQQITLIVLRALFIAFTVTITTIAVASNGIPWKATQHERVIGTQVMDSCLATAWAIEQDEIFQPGNQSWLPYLKKNYKSLIRKYKLYKLSKQIHK